MGNDLILSPVKTGREFVLELLARFGIFKLLEAATYMHRSPEVLTWWDPAARGGDHTSRWLWEWPRRFLMRRQIGKTNLWYNNLLREARMRERGVAVVHGIPPHVSPFDGERFVHLTADYEHIERLVMARMMESFAVPSHMFTPMPPHVPRIELTMRETPPDYVRSTMPLGRIRDPANRNAAMSFLEARRAPRRP